jgi:hypothetical protein
MKDTDYIREYINLFLLEKIKKTDEIVSSFQRRLQTTALKTNSEDEALTKQKVDEAIARAVGPESDKNLELPEVRAKIMDRAYESINSVMRKNFNKIIAQNFVGGSRRNIQEAFNPKLILSEIFMAGDGQGLEPDDRHKDPEPSGDGFHGDLGSGLIGGTGAGGSAPADAKYDVAEFEKALPTLDTKGINCKKAFLFFDVLEKYNFRVDFEGEKAESFEGHLLKLVYADEETLNYFVLRKSFFRFVKAFVDAFHIEYEARLKPDNLAAAGHLVLLASYSPQLCKHLDTLEFVEQLLGRIESVQPAEHHLLLKVFINLFKNKSPMVQKLVSLRVFERLLEEILKTDSQANVALFSILMSRASQDHINTKQFISKELLGRLFERIAANFSTYEDLKVIAIKNKSKPSEFRVGEVSDPVLLIDLYCRDYYELIRQKLSIRQFRRMYYMALGFLKFVSRFNAKLDDAQKVAYCRVITDLLAVFFYQGNIVDAALVSFKKLLCPTTVDFLLEEFFETHLLSNCFTIFERGDFSRDNTATLSHFQGLLLGLVEACQSNGIALKVRQLKKILDRIFQIRQLIGAFYYRLKSKYLAKGLLKYVNKLKKHLMKEVLFPLDEILSQNALILQKLSHSQILDENVLLYASRNSTVNFERQSEAGQVGQLVAAANQLLYIASKVDRKEGYLEDVITFNLHVIGRLERFVDGMEARSEHHEFDFIESILEFLIVHTYFVKTYDESARKITSVRALKKTVDLLVRILGMAKRFVDLQSNHQIFTLLENVGQFWLLFFDFNYRFYDRLSFAFIDNLKTLSRASADNKVDAFSDEALYRLLVCLNEFVDLKSKNSLLNFVILKQLDTVFLTLTNVSPTNLNFLVNIFQKVFGSNYGAELHRLQQKYFLSLSVKTLGVEGVKQPFLDFVCKNNLYLNKYVGSLLRNLLDKNFEIEQVRRLTAPQKALFNHAVLETPLDPSPEMTQYLLTQIQQNIRNKTLFEDLVLILRRHLKHAAGAPNAEIVRKLFLSESIFWKLVRLYKKDQLNLSKILKYLLLICKHFNFLGEIAVPPSVVRSILGSREINKFNDVYMLLLTYIFKNNKYADFQADVERFFVHTKESLDSLLFFSKQVNLDGHLRTIYYSLKVLRNCAGFVKGVPALASLDADDFAVRFVLQLMDENSRLEVVPVNNLFNHFRKRESVQPNFKTALYEAKIVGLVFAILRENPRLFEALLDDFFVVNKLISFAYLAVGSKNYPELIPMIARLLQRGLAEPEKEIFKDVYYDFYLLLNYDFGYADDGLAALVKEHVYEKKRSVIPALRRLVDEVKRRTQKFDSMGFNSVIRALLKVYFIVENFGGELYLENYQDVAAALDQLLESAYKEVHSLTKLEKLVVNLYFLVHSRTLIGSVNSARVFLWLFNTHVEFKVSSLVDKYIYMGLFNSYLRQPREERLLRLDPETGDITPERQPLPDSPAKLPVDQLTFEPEKVTEALDQLRFKGLVFANEVILTKFLVNLFKLNRERFYEVKIKNEIVLDKTAAVLDGLKSFAEADDNGLRLLKARLKFLSIFVKKEVSRPATEESPFLAEWMKIPPAIEALVADPKFEERISQKLGLKIVLLLVKLVRTLYKLVAVKNEAFLKPALLQCFYTLWNRLGEIKLDETGAKNRLKQAVLRATMRIMRNRYDEMRFVLYRNYLPSIFDYFAVCHPAKDDQVLLEGKGEGKEGQAGAEEPKPEGQEDGAPKKPEEAPPAGNPEDQKLINASQKAPQAQAAQEVAAPVPNAAEAEGQPAPPCYMSNAITSEGLLEPTFYLFYLVSRNQLLMNIDYKQKTFATIRERKDILVTTRFCRLIYEFLEKEYNSTEQRPGESLVKASTPAEAELSLVPKPAEAVQPKSAKEFGDKEPPMSSKHINIQDGAPPTPLLRKAPPKDPLTVENASLRLKESSLSHKQKNILYVHKVLTTVHDNLNKNGVLNEREETYLNFGLIALHKHLLENLDPELFNAFGFFGLVAAFAVDDRLPPGYKRDCLEILKLFLATCQGKNNVQPAETKGLLVFYERLLFDNFPELATLYFDLLLLIFTHIPFTQEFLDEYMDKMSFCLFEAYSSISEAVFIPALAVFVHVLQTARPKIDAQRVGNAVYAFVKINNKDMKFYERTLFVLLIAYLESAGGLDAVKLENAKHFVRFSHAMEGFDRTPAALAALLTLTETHDQFQKLLKSVNFEAVYKAVFKHHSEDLPVLQTATRLFLRYTYKIEENKFEMFECIRLILRDVRRFFRKEGPENRAFVLLLYKSLVNASLHKENAEYLVKSDLGKVLRECVYHRDAECAVVVISLLFNICYIFEKEEFHIRKFVTDGLMTLLGELFEEALEARQDATICELIDLFVGFIQHQFTEFFSRDMVAKIKLTLNLYFNSLEITLKFLNILRDITLTSPDHVKALVRSEFDYIYLYHVHYRNLKNAKVNSLAKHVIFNLLTHRGKDATEQELVTFGIPENVVHTFSLEDNDVIMILNLRIILLSLRFEKCLYFVRNNFLAVVREILYAKPGRYKDDVTYYCFDILKELLAAFKDPQLLNAAYYFDRTGQLFDLMMICLDRDDYLIVLLKLLKNGIDNDRGRLNEITQANKVFMHELIGLKSKAKNRELMALVYSVSAFVDIRESLMDNKLNLTRNKQVSPEERAMLEAGQAVVVYFRAKLHKNALIKFDFVKNKYYLLNVDLTPHPKKTEKRKFGFLVSRVDALGFSSPLANEQIENNFRTYFMRSLKKELYFSFLVLDEDPSGVNHETVFLIFENEFKCAKWKGLMAVLSGKN